MTSRRVRLRVRRDRESPYRWLWEVYEVGHPWRGWSISLGCCDSWEMAMTFGILTLHRASGLPLPKRPESGVLV